MAQEKVLEAQTSQDAEKDTLAAQVVRPRERAFIWPRDLCNNQDAR
jgi:hypothetical protein